MNKYRDIFFPEHLVRLFSVFRNFNFFLKKKNACENVVDFVKKGIIRKKTKHSS